MSKVFKVRLHYFILEEDKILHNGSKLKKWKKGEIFYLCPSCNKVCGILGPKTINQFELVQVEQPESLEFCQIKGVYFNYNDPSIIGAVLYAFNECKKLNSCN